MHLNDKTGRLWKLGGKILPCLLAVAAAFLLYQPAQSGLDARILSLPQGFFWGYGLEPQRVYPMQMSMPLAPVLDFLVCLFPAGAEPWLWPVFYLCAAALAGTLALELTASAWAGALAGALSATVLAARMQYLLFTSETILLTLSCSLVAYLLVRREGARRRSAAMEAATGAAIGLSLLVKSPLFLLAPLLALIDLLRGKLKRGETSWKNLALLCVLPYALLLPWTAVNLWLTGKFILLEHGRADENIISGALGIAATIEGAASLARLPEGAGTFGWALAHILSHPLQYASGVIRRIFLLASWYPAGTALAVLAFARHRRDSRMRGLLLFLVYYAALHCLMSVQEAYFAPLWPCAGAAAACAFFTLRKPGAAPSRFAARAYKAVFLLCSALAVLACWLLLSYPYRLNPKPDTARLSGPALALLAEQRLAQGSEKEALELSRRAYAERPGNYTKRAYFYCLAALKTDIGPLLEKDPFAGTTPQDRRELGYLRLANALQNAPDGRLQAALAEARLDWRYADSSFRAVTSLRETQIQNRLRLDDGDFLEVDLPDLVLKFPPKQRVALIGRLEKCGAGSVRLEELKEQTLFESRPPQDRERIRQEKLLALARRISAEYERLQPKTAQEFGTWRRVAQAMGADDDTLRRLSAFMRDTPQAKRRFKRIEYLHESKRYAMLVPTAQEYLRDYPYDQVAALFLTVGLLNTGDLPQAALCLDKADYLSFEEHERKWLKALKANLARELARSRI